MGNGGQFCRNLQLINYDFNITNLHHHFQQPSNKVVTFRFKRMVDRGVIFPYNIRRKYQKKIKTL
jgi:hypothetical protein